MLFQHTKRLRAILVCVDPGFSDIRVEEGRPTLRRREETGRAEQRNRPE